MRVHSPAFLVTRPVFWPWSPGQQLVLTTHEDESWACPIFEYQLLNAWRTLPASPQPAQASAFLTELGAQRVTQHTPAAALRLLEARKLVRWSPWFSVWYCTDPRMVDGADVIPPEEFVLRRKIIDKLTQHFANAASYISTYFSATHWASGGFAANCCPHSPARAALLDLNWLREKEGEVWRVNMV